MVNSYGFIYMTINLINGKMYIGQRKYQGKNDKYYLGSGVIFQKAVKKYGRKNFARIILEEASSKEQLDDLEKDYISMLNAVEDSMFYNVAPGGLAPGGLVGHVCSDYCKQRVKDTCGKAVYCFNFEKVFDSISDCADFLDCSINKVVRAIENRWLVNGVEVCYAKDLEQYSRISKEEILNRKLQKKKYLEDKAKKLHTPEARKKSAETRKGKPGNRSRKVIRIEDNKIFDSAEAASTYLGLARSAVSNAMKKRVRVGGFEFCYLDELEKYIRLPSVEEVNAKTREARSKVLKTANNREVVDIDTLEEFPSALECDRAHGWHDGATGKVCRGERRQCFGHRFKFKS